MVCSFSSCCCGGEVVAPQDLCVKRPGTDFAQAGSTTSSGTARTPPVPRDRVLVEADIAGEAGARSDACAVVECAPVSAARRRIAVVTGTRAEWGLLAPCRRISATTSRFGFCRSTPSRRATVAVPRTIAEVEAFAGLCASCARRRVAPLPKSSARATGRADDAAALGRGVSALAAEFARLSPDFVMVLGDRIEAFAAGRERCIDRRLSRRARPRRRYSGRCRQRADW
jgi:hypothetical protein